MQPLCFWGAKKRLGSHVYICFPSSLDLAPSDHVFVQKTRNRPYFLLGSGISKPQRFKFSSVFALTDLCFQYIQYGRINLILIAVINLGF